MSSMFNEELWYGHRTPQIDKEMNTVLAIIGQADVRTALEVTYDAMRVTAQLRMLEEVLSQLVTKKHEFDIAQTKLIETLQKIFELIASGDRNWTSQIALMVDQTTVATQALESYTFQLQGFEAAAKLYEESLNSMYPEPMQEIMCTLKLMKDDIEGVSDRFEIIKIGTKQISSLSQSQ